MLKRTVDDITTVPEAFRPLYEQGEDGKYHLQAIEGLMPVTEAEERINAIDGKKAEILNEKKQLQARLKELESKAPKAPAQPEVDTEALERQLREQFDGERQGFTSKLTAQRQQIENLLFKTAFEAEILKGKGEPELLLPHMRNRVRFNEGEDGTLTMDILNAHGSPMLGPKGERATPADIVKEYKAHPVFGRGFEGTGSSGAGLSPGGRTAGQPARNPFAKDSFNLTEQMKLAKENPALASELKKQAAGASTQAA